MPTMHVIVSGKVQGVFYRANAKKKADALEIKGWVKNNRDGSVELMITGSPDKVEKMLAWCKKGPEGAIVSEVKAQTVDEKPFSCFLILR